MDGRPSRAYIASNVGDRDASASSAKRLMVRSGWSCGIRVSKSMNASIVTCGSCSPRTPTTSARDGSTVSGATTSPEEPPDPKMGVFQHTASGERRLLIDRRPPGAAHRFDADDQGNGTLTQQRLYHLIRQPLPVADRRLDIEFLDMGVAAYAFTFG